MSNLKLLLLILSILTVFLVIMNIIFAILYRFSDDELSINTHYKIRKNWLYTNIVLAILCLMVIFLYVSLFLTNKFRN